MTDTSTPDDGDSLDGQRIDSWVRDLPDPQVATDFADRVVALHAEASRNAHKGRRLTLIAAVSASALAVCGVVAVALAQTNSSGELVASVRQPLTLDGVTAVLEPGTQVNWRVDGKLGADAVELDLVRGGLFVRVVPGTALSVTTPLGTATALGTAFVIDLTSENPSVSLTNPTTNSANNSGVSAMSSSAFSPPVLSILKPAAVGAAAGVVLGSVLAVMVLEGAVSVSNPNGTVVAQAGDSAVAMPGQSPSLHQSTRPAPALMREDMVTIPRAEIEALRQARAATPDVNALVARNQELEDRLQKANAELALADEVRRAEEGEPLKFPEDLPPRFAGPELQRAFETAMNEVGIKGGVIEVDCSEYPCLVYGQVSSREDMERLRESQAFAPYAKDSNNTSVWGVRNNRDGVEVHESYFGVALRPDGEKLDPVQSDRVERRTRAGWDRIQPKDD